MDPAKDKKKSSNNVHEALTDSFVRMCTGLNPSKLGKTGDIDAPTYERTTGKKNYTVNGKAFLGRTIRQFPNMESIGHRVARASGVIVDENGKLRCPPGTPNANQFTDLAMTGCMDFKPSSDPVERARLAGTREERATAKRNTAARIAMVEEKFGPLDNIENQKAALSASYPNAEIDLEERHLDRISPAGRRRVKAARRAFVAGLLVEAEEFPEVADNITKISDALLPTEDNDNWAQTLWRVENDALDIEIGMSQFGAAEMSASELKMSTSVQPASDLDAYWHHASVHEFGHAVDLVNVLNQMGMEIDASGKVRHSQPHAFDKKFDQEFERLSKNIDSIRARMVEGQYRRNMNRKPKAGDENVDEEYDIAMREMSSFLREKINQGIHRQFDSFDDMSEFDEIVERSGSEYAEKSFQQTKSIAEAKAEMFARARILGYEKPSIDDIQLGMKKKSSKDYLRSLLGTNIKGANDLDDPRYSEAYDPTPYELLTDIEQLFGDDQDRAAAFIDTMTDIARRNVLADFDQRKARADTLLANGEMSQEEYQNVLAYGFSIIPEQVFRNLAGMVSIARESDKKPGIPKNFKHQSWRSPSKGQYKRVRRLKPGSRGSDERTDQRLAIANPRRIAGGRNDESVSERVRQRNQDVIQKIEQEGGFFDRDGVPVEEQQRLIDSHADWVASKETQDPGRQLSEKMLPKPDDKSAVEYLSLARARYMQFIDRELGAFDDAVAEIQGFIQQHLAEFPDPDSSTITNFNNTIASLIAKKRIYEAQKEFLDGLSDEQLASMIADLMRSEVEDEDTRIAVQIPFQTDRFFPFLDEGYKTVHEVQGDFAGAAARAQFETAHGIPGNASSSVRPASGYMVYGSRRRYLRDQNPIPDGEDPELFSPSLQSGVMNGEAGKAMQYGGVQVIMRPEIMGRSRFGWGDSFNSFYVAAPMRGATDEELVKSVVGSHGGINTGFRGDEIVGKRFNADHFEQVIEVLRLGRPEIMGSWAEAREEVSSVGWENTDTVSRQFYHEAMVYGSFDLSDVEEIVLPESSFEPVLPDKLKARRISSGEILTTDQLRSGTREWGGSGDYNAWIKDRIERHLDTLLESGAISKEQFDYLVAVFSQRAINIDAENYVKRLLRIAGLQRKHERRMEIVSQIQERNQDVKISFQNEYGIDWLNSRSHIVAIGSEAKDLESVESIDEMYNQTMARIIPEVISQLQSNFGLDPNATGLVIDDSGFG